MENGLPTWIGDARAIKVIESGLYVDVTDYLRDVVRKDLKARGASSTRALKVSRTLALGGP